MSVLARLSLANRGLIGLLSLLIVGFGAFALPSLKQQLLPSIQLPAAVVIAPYPGASPDAVDSQVAEPIESALRGLAGVDNITTRSAESSATIQVQFTYGTDIDAAVSQMQQAVNRLRPTLPQGVEPTVAQGSTDDIPVVILAAQTGADETATANRLRTEVVSELESITGVRAATITGTRAQTVTITLDYAKLAAAGVDPTALAGTLGGAGTPIPAGTVTDGTRSLTVQVGGPIKSVDDLRAMTLPSRGAPVKLGDVATVEAGLADTTAITRTDGKPTLGIMVTMSQDGNAVEISKTIKDKLGELSKDAQTELTVAYDQGPEVQKAIGGLTSEGLLGLLFAVAVILLFLLSLRSTLVTAVSIPLSVLVALIALWMGDLSLNLLTLSGLTIAIGRVVDDSIVVLENIKRHLSYGEEKQRAVLDGTREVSGAVTASTLTTVAVFLPIAFLSGLAGEFFGPFAITVTVALIASLLVSLTIVPVLAYWFLRRPPVSADPEAAEAARVAAVEKERRSPLQRAYVPVLEFATKRRAVTLLIAVLIFGGTIGLASRLETNFLDDSNAATLQMSQELPPGASMRTRDEAAKKLEQVLARTDEIEVYQVTVGTDDTFAGFGFSSNGTNTINATVKEGTNVADLRAKLGDQFKADPSMGVVKLGAEANGFGASGVQVIVTAPDGESLTKAADTVQKAVEQVPGLAEVDNDLAKSSPRVQVVVDQQAAAARGLSSQAIGQFATQALRGTPVAELPIGGARHDIVLRTGAAPADVAALKALPLPSATGPVTLGEVAQVSTVDGPVQVRRTGGDRSATVSAKTTGSDLGKITQDLTNKLNGVNLTGGAKWEIGGVSAEQAETFGDLGLAMLAGIVMVFLIMMATFHSLIQPLILLVSIPFAATGAIILLLVTGTPLGLPAMIGMLMLIGIVVTNAIVLIDLINQYRSDGMSVRDAVIEGGRRRLRPILMTAAATIFALVPMALGITGEGGFIGKPLALVVIGGLISSTLLTLVLVPTLYTMVENRKERRNAKRTAKHALAEDPQPVNA
ncbi:RND multidrug efflux transporter; Acriflavin resistance protein [Alloactinosynnema sp. L-07]|uniref:efflux RND transporter permease subunit n=1 Tax=Alloactinosynnema sp. L-07 TaxID=1653480 RepID=UPI00065EF23D|nr:efflux RND transporter permease subunit [Alloactinosynnema sp. L-07]CRK55822.1 RND multidrug efflux transporter; Acriflavin resistance protein [Alloactinosynnema sp. L-07]